MYSRTFYPLLLALLAGLFFTACSDTSGNPAGGKTLSGIAVTVQPTKTSYYVNQALDLTGLVVTATYSDSSTETLTSITAANTDWNTVKATAGNGKTVTITYSGKTATFTVTVLDDPHGIVMISIPAGTFTMGSPERETSSYYDERPQHSVTLSAFNMGKTEVTQAQWQAVMGNNPSNFTGDAQRPAEKVSWFDAIAFCNKLSIIAGLEPVYSVSGINDWASLAYGSIPTTPNTAWDAAEMDRSKSGYRLPTEAEWEYACRAGTTTAWYTGDTEDAALQGAAWYSANASNTTHPVGEKTANAFGLHDMHGNVLEWCWDWYGNYGTNAQTDPVGPRASRRQLEQQLRRLEHTVGESEQHRSFGQLQLYRVSCCPPLSSAFHKQTRHAYRKAANEGVKP